MSSHGGSSHETDRPLRARDQLPNALPGRTAQSEPQHHQGLPRCVHAPAPLLSRPARRSVEYLSKELLAQILAQPDLRTPSGRRDAVLLSVLYDTGARVQELIDLNAGDVRLDSPAQVRLMGKGQKMRAVPLMDATVDIVRDRGREN